MPPLALIVEPCAPLGVRLEAIAHAAGWRVRRHTTLEEARRDVGMHTPTIVVTSMRLGSFNGVHLVYLTKLANPNAICVVYGDDARADEAWRAGALYERRDVVPFAFARLLSSMTAPAFRPPHLQPLDAATARIGTIVVQRSNVQ